MKYSGDQVLRTMSEHARNRNNSIYSLMILAFHLSAQKTASRSILEFGAGKGEFIDRFRKIAKVQTSALEIDPVYLKILRRRHQAYSQIGRVKRKFDYVFAIDVLEHIENDLASMRSLAKLLNPSGRLFIYVPARPELYSKFDQSIGHYRRYVLGELITKSEQAGLVVERAYYHDFLGYFAAIFNKLTSKGELNPRMVSLYDQVFFPISMMIEKLIRPPIGKSIVLLARKR